MLWQHPRYVSKEPHNPKCESALLREKLDGDNPGILEHKGRHPVEKTELKAHEWLTGRPNQTDRCSEVRVSSMVGVFVPGQHPSNRTMQEGKGAVHRRGQQVAVVIFEITCVHTGLCVCACV